MLSQLVETLPAPRTKNALEESAAAPDILVCGLEDRVPAGTALLVGAQHVSAMVVGTITPPLLLASALKFSPTDTAYFISIALLSSALGTILQCRQRGPLGAGLLSVTGTSFAVMQTLTQAGHAGGLAMMFGMSWRSHRCSWRWQRFSRGLCLSAVWRKQSADPHAAWTGWKAAARRAGMEQATMPIIVSSTATPTNTPGSWGKVRTSSRSLPSVGRPRTRRRA